jgi:23S rRNA (guanine745-N1)-methyltransferase
MSGSRKTERWPIACPLCDRPMFSDGTTLTCASGHSFDIAKEGYVNLLPAQHRVAGIDGDTAEMLRARSEFLDAGYYQPLREMLADIVEEALRDRSARLGDEDRATCVLEVGCGEGYYIDGIAERLKCGGFADTTFVGADLSKAAVKRASKRYPHVSFIVADTNRRIYVRDASVSVLLDVFAPRNPAEFARVLEPGGLAVVVIPSESHLESVRKHLDLIGIQEGKEALVLERFGSEFRMTERLELRYPLELSREAARALREMGPSYWHRREDRTETPENALTTEASFILLCLRRS